jgi:uncharacterized protein
VSRDVLIAFVKAPRPGANKTRLAAHVGDAAALSVYRGLAAETLRRTAPAGDAYERLVFFTPAEAGPEVGEWLPGEALLPQVEGDLGQRMAAAFEEAFRRGARRVAIVGTDVPGLSAQIVGDALAALEDHDAVLGPARDGGYCLLALARACPALFQGIAWGTPAVLPVTLQRATALGLRLRLLAPLRDIDTLEDLRAEWDLVAPLLDEAARVAIEAAMARD